LDIKRMGFLPVTSDAHPQKKLTASCAKEKVED